MTDIISVLSGLFGLRAGDPIFTGTPAGVGAVRRRDVVRCGIEGLGEISTSVIWTGRRRDIGRAPTSAFIRSAHLSCIHERALGAV